MVWVIGFGLVVWVLRFRLVEWELGRGVVLWVLGGLAGYTGVLEWFRGLKEDMFERLSFSGVNRGTICELGAFNGIKVGIIGGLLPCGEYAAGCPGMLAECCGEYAGRTGILVVCWGEYGGDGCVLLVLSGVNICAFKGVKVGIIGAFCTARFDLKLPIDESPEFMDDLAVSLGYSTVVGIAVEISLCSDGG